MSPRIPDVIRTHEAELRALGVNSLAVFGSAVRGEERPGSDIDLLVEFDRPFGLFLLIEVQIRLEELLGRRVDLVPRNSIHPELREQVLAEAEELLAAA